MVELIFETHSLSEDNEAGIATGWNPGRLSEEGRRVAAQLGERHRAQPPRAVFTSDLSRAVETAQIAFATTKIPIHQDSRLRECNYGKLTGMPVERLDTERLRHVHTPFPDGESYEQVTEKVRRFLAVVEEGWSGSRVVVIGHSATKWALDHILEGRLLEDLVRAPFDWQEGWHYRLGRNARPRPPLASAP